MEKTRSSKPGTTGAAEDARSGETPKPAASSSPPVAPGARPGRVAAPANGARAPHRALGLDLAKSTGLVVIDADGAIVHATTYSTTAPDEAGQCLQIRDLVDDAIKRFGPFAVVGIEDTFLGQNVRLLKHLSRFAGASLVTLGDHAAPYLFLPTNRARKTLRLPFYPKAEVHRVLRARRTVPKGLSKDELDAYVVALAALRLVRRGAIPNDPNRKEIPAHA